MKKGSILSFRWSLLTPVVVLVVLGLTTLFSINISYFKSQLIFFIFSLFVFVIVSNVNFRILRHYSVPIYVVSIVVLFLVLIIGMETRGAVRWVELFGLKIQFSELFKPFLAVSLASFLSSRKDLSLKNLLLCGLLSLPVIFLIFIQPDLGNAIIYGGVLILTILIFGFSYIWFILGAGILALFMPVLWRFMHDYQKQRLLTFLDPGKDPLGTSYNAIQSIVAVGSGMFMGKGLGQGTQSTLRFLPERHTDFIFATFTEEFGFLGAMFLIITFGIILYKICVFFGETDDKFSKTFLATAFFLILIQFFVNVGMNIGLLPVVGVTLPFVSYGGSSLLSNFILLGLISSITRDFKERQVLEIK